MAVAEPYMTRRTLRGRMLTRRPSLLARVSWGDRIGVALLLIVTIVAIVGPWFAPYKPGELASTSALPIAPFHHGFLFGTDSVGHDIFSRVLYGTRTTWFAALEVIASGVLIGGFVGVVAGAAGGWVDNVLMRFTDIFLALPAPLLAIAVVASLGPSLNHTLIAVAIVWWPFYARIVRGEIKAFAARPHIEAARLSGVGRFRLTTRHLVPGAVPATVVTASLDVGNLILLLSILSFLGLGAQWPSSELALNSSHGLQYILTDWWIAVVPGVAIFVLALVANLAGDGLRDLLARDDDEGARMGGLIAKRVVAMFGILLVLTAIVFGVQQLSPTDPVHDYLGANSSPAQIAAAKHTLGYDRPLVVQYVRYVGDLLHGNLQTSLRTRQPVATDLGHALPATLELALAAMLIAAVLAVVLGVASAARWRGAGIFRFILVASGSVPAFLAAILGIVLFYNHLHWVPTPGRTAYVNAPSGPTGLLTIDGLVHGRLSVTVDAIRHLMLPSLAVALVPAVSVGRVLRSSLTSALHSDYVRTARAKGLSERVVLLRHTMRNSAGAALSMGGLQVGLMFAGVLVVEVVYNWPGIGLYTYQSINRSDLPAIAGVTVLLGAVYVVINTIVDILQAVADPRIVL